MNTEQKPCCFSWRRTFVELCILLTTFLASCLIWPDLQSEAHSLISMATYFDYWVLPIFMTIFGTCIAISLSLGWKNIMQSLLLALRPYQGMALVDAIKTSYKIIRAAQHFWIIFGSASILVHIYNRSILVGPPLTKSSDECWLHILGVLLFSGYFIGIGIGILEVLKARLLCAQFSRAHGQAPQFGDSTTTGMKEQGDD